jgi:hypothetical protein
MTSHLTSQEAGQRGGAGRSKESVQWISEVTELDVSGDRVIALKTSENSERLRKLGGHEFAEDIRPRLRGKMFAARRTARGSVHSATDGDTSRCHDGSSGNGTTCDGHGSARADAARPVNTSSANDGACFRGTQGDEAP